MGDGEQMKEFWKGWERYEFCKYWSRDVVHPQRHITTVYVFDDGSLQLKYDTPDEARAAAEGLVRGPVRWADEEEGMNHTRCDCWYCQTLDRLVALFPGQEEAIKDAITDSQTGLDQDLEDSVLLAVQKITEECQAGRIPWNQEQLKELTGLYKENSVGRFPGWKYKWKILGDHWTRMVTEDGKVIGKFVIVKVPTLNKATLCYATKKDHTDYPCDNPSQAHRLAEAIVENSKLRWVE